MTTPEWNDPAAYEWGTEPTHASLMPYETLDEAMRADRRDSPYRLSLDGEWKFHWSSNPASRLLDFAGEDVDGGGPSRPAAVGDRGPVTSDRCRQRDVRSRGRRPILR
ncbi:hypothetical protein MRBLWS13_002952 [Microbacterium sp. LWS13-1.2]|uniref:beta-galactosidase n=1 Tax=Microbacterium sp. LWS13-1.2 TaxID=3135264 RepID=A0AAU6SEF5_9MICO